MLLDYTTNCNIDNPKTSLSHAFLIKAYAEGLYPFGDKKTTNRSIANAITILNL